MAEPQAARTKYRVLNYLISYGAKHVPAGSVVDDIPPKSIGWLIAEGSIEPAEDDAELRLIAWPLISEAV